MSWRGNPNRLGDRIIFWLCAALTFIFYSNAIYDLGRTHERAEPKKCASVQGMEVVSSNADFCTYANSFGRATTKRRAG
jgi:hypothetical protein